MCRYVSYHPDDPVSDHPDDLYYWPAIWIRDSGGRQLAHHAHPGQNGMNGEDALRLEVIPPLNRATAWIEMLAAGQSAQARASLPLRWQRRFHAGRPVNRKRLPVPAAYESESPAAEA